MAQTDKRIPFVGLTGGIAAGKSEALAALERLGAATLSSDAIVHELLAGEELRALLVARFGDQIAPDGDVDRSRLAEVVFADPEQRAWLEGELWPRVGRRIADWREQTERSASPPEAIVVEVPLLFEADMESFFDHTVAVVADEPTRRRRAAERGHAGLEGRSSRQLSQEEKAQRAEFVIANDGGLPDLERKLSEMLATIRR
jgi:dephospho-CoA kinase